MEVPHFHSTLEVRRLTVGQVIQRLLWSDQKHGYAHRRWSGIAMGRDYPPRRRYSPKKQEELVVMVEWVQEAPLQEAQLLEEEMLAQ